jgi:hypothetical protein
MFGIPRCMRVSLPTIERNVLAPLRHLGEVSVHYHLYRLAQVINPRSGEQGRLAAENYDCFGSFSGVLEASGAAFTGTTFAGWQAFGDAFGDDFASLRNLRSQLYSLERVTGLVAAEKPGVVVFIRPDLCYHDVLPAGAVRYAARQPAACVVPVWQWWHGYNDRFAICGAESYRAYGRRGQLAEEFCRTTGGPLHSERLLRFALRRARCRMRVMTTQASRVRVDGTVVRERFDGARTRAGDAWLRWEHRLLSWLSRNLSPG